MKVQYLVLLIFGCVVFFLGLLYFIFFSESGKTLILDKFSFQFRKSINQDIQFENQISDQEFTIDKAINDNSKILEIIKGTDVDRFLKKIIITSDPTKKGASYWKNGKLISGYGYQIDYDTETVYLFIFLNEAETLNPGDQIYNVNMSYIGALLAAAEKNKADKTVGYTSNYDNVRIITHEIITETYDVGNYFINFK